MAEAYIFLSTTTVIITKTVLIKCLLKITKKPSFRMRELGRNGSKSRKDCGGQRENGRREGGPAARCPVPGCDSGETWDDSCGGKGTASTRPTVPPRDAGEAERGWLVASSALGRPVRSPQAPGPALPGVLVGVLRQPHQVVHQRVCAVPGAREKLLSTDLLQNR